MALQIDAQAQQLLSFVQQQTSRIDAKLESQIAQKATEKGQILSKAEVEQILVQAMPEHKEKIGKLSGQCMCHQSDGTNGQFLTQMVGVHKIRKENDAVYTQPSITRVARDPLSAKFIMANDADVMLLFNAAKFDEQGKPLLMKIVARESMKDKLPDISNYHTLTKTPDVQLVPNDAAYVTIEDTNEAEFSFGDPIAHVSLNAKGKELSRGGAVAPSNEQLIKYFYGMNSPTGVVPNPQNPAPVAPTTSTGHQLDHNHVQRYEDRIEVAMRAKETLPAGSWLEASAQHMETKLTLQPGYLLEPGTSATVSFAGVNLKTKVAADDFSFNGSTSASGEVDGVAYKNYNLAQFLQQNVRQTTMSDATGGYDQQDVDQPIYKAIYPHPERIDLGGVTLNPLGDRVVKKADFAAAKIDVKVKPLKADPEKNGQEIVLDLAKGFLSGKDGQSMAGWRIEAGYRGGASQSNEWVGTKAVTCDESGSPKSCLSLALPNAPEALQNNTNLEIRVYNAQGIPAQRILVPLTELPWAN